MMTGQRGISLWPLLVVLAIGCVGAPHMIKPSLELSMQSGA
jgi:hypothetical protein